MRVNASDRAVARRAERAAATAWPQADPPQAPGPLEERAWPGLLHHYKHNTHHPEHYEDGIAGMLFPMEQIQLLKHNYEWSMH